MIRSIHLVPILAAPSVSHAEQFVLFDVTFTFTKEDADNSKPSKSHYYVKGDMLNPDRPRDWTAPVDYRNGTVHIRTEVIEKPAGGEPTTWTLCYIPNKGQGNGYGCTGTGLYREKGVYEKDVSMKSFWENDVDRLVGGHQADGPGHQGQQRRQAMPTSGPTRRSSSRPRCGSPWSRCRPARRTTRACYRRADSGQRSDGYSTSRINIE